MVMDVMVMMMMMMVVVVVVLVILSYCTCPAPQTWLTDAVFVFITGYGNITPRTTAGRVVCILYALFGIPLTCLTLKSIGENLLDAIVAVMARIKQRIRERISCPETCTRHAIGRGPVLVLNVCLWLLTLVGLSILGQFRRSWTFLESLYFCFITFSTIGFGDYVPFPEGAMHEFADYVVMLLGVVLGFAVTSTMLCSLGSLFEESWQLPALPVLPARTVFDRFCHLFSFSIIPDKKVGALAPLETETQLAEDIRRKPNLTERTEVNKKKRISVG